MRYLLDSHTLLWSVGQSVSRSVGRSDRLSSTARDLIRDRANQVVVSSVSLWKISLKYGIGKLVLSSMAPDDIPAHCESLGFGIVHLDASDTSTYHTLPRLSEHRDPFDRMLVHQCIRMQAGLVTRDWRAMNRTGSLASGRRGGAPGGSDRTMRMLSLVLQHQP